MVCCLRSCAILSLAWHLGTLLSKLTSPFSSRHKVAIKLENQALTQRSYNTYGRLHVLYSGEQPFPPFLPNVFAWAIVITAFDYLVFPVI